MSLWIIGYKLHEGREGLVTSISAGSQTAPYEEISPSLEQTRLGDSTGRGVRGSKMVFCHVNAFRLPPMRHENPYSVCLQELVLRRYQSLGVTAFPRVLKLLKSGDGSGCCARRWVDTLPLHLNLHRLTTTLRVLLVPTRF